MTLSEHELRYLNFRRAAALTYSGPKVTYLVNRPNLGWGQTILWACDSQTQSWALDRTMGFGPQYTERIDATVEERRLDPFLKF